MKSVDGRLLKVNAVPSLLFESLCKICQKEGRVTWKTSLPYWGLSPLFLWIICSICGFIIIRERSVEEAWLSSHYHKNVLTKLRTWAWGRTSSMRLEGGGCFICGAENGGEIAENPLNNKVPLCTVVGFSSLLYKNWQKLFEVHHSFWKNLCFQD